MPTRRLTPVLIALLALVAAGCGSSSNASSESAQSLLSQTFSSGPAVKSGRLSVQLDANLQGLSNLNGPVRLRLTGPFQSQGSGKMPRFAFTLGLSGSGGSFTAGGISTGDHGYVLFQGQPYVLSAKLFSRF